MKKKHQGTTFEPEDGGKEFLRVMKRLNQLRIARIPPIQNFDRPPMHDGYFVVGVDEEWRVVASFGYSKELQVVLSPEQAQELAGMLERSAKYAVERPKRKTPADVVNDFRRAIGRLEEYVASKPAKTFKHKFYRKTFRMPLPASPTGTATAPKRRGVSSKAKRAKRREK